MNRIVPVLLIGAYIAWMAFWFRAFGHSFSSSFFQHHLGMRLPTLILEMLAIAVPPLTGYWAVTRTLRRKVGALRAFAVNLLVSGAPLFISWAYYGIVLNLARKRGELAFEADEAMGIGIVYLICLGIFLATNVVVALILIGWKLVRRQIEDSTSPRASI